MVNPRRKRRGGKKGSTRRKRRGGKRGKRSSYRSFVKREMPGMLRGGKSPKQAMKAIGAKWSGGKKSVKRTSRRRGRSNWGTRAGGRKGWNQREKRAKGYKRTRGARYPPRHKAPRISKAKRRRAALKGWRKKHGHKARANPRHKRHMRHYRRHAAANPRHRRHRKKGRSNKRRAGARRRRSRRRNPMALGVGTKIDRHIKPTYGRTHMKFMASCLRQRGGRGGMKACAKMWKKQSGKHGQRQPHWKRRANPEYAMAPSHIGHKLESFGGKLGFPSRKDWFPSWEQVKAHKLGTLGGAAIGTPSAYGFGTLFRTALPKNPAGAEVLGFAGGVLGTELPARVWKKWGPERASKDTTIRSMRAFGYGTTVVMGVLGIVKLAQAKGGKLSGLGDVATKAKEFAKEVAAKAKKALGMGIFGTERGIEDVVSSGWDQGYTGQEPLGVSGPMDEAVSKLDARIKGLAKELGLSGDEVTEMMRQEGYDIGRYPTYAENPYDMSSMGYLDYQLSGMGQAGSPPSPLLGDSNVPPAERDIFRSDFVV